MLTRRGFLSGAAIAVAAPAVAGPIVAGPIVAAPIAEAAPRTLLLDLVNRRRGRRMYAVVTGVDPATGRWFFLASDGRSRVFPRTAGTSLQRLSSDISIALPTSGVPRRLRLPRMASGRVYLSLERRLSFFVTPGGGIATPSVANPDDPNAGVDWSFVELTFDQAGVYANLSFVDFVGLPVSMRLATSGKSQYVGGLRRGGLSQIAHGLRAQSAEDHSGWHKLIVRSGGHDVRILSPNLAADAGGRSPVAGYLDGYIDQVWNKYRRATLVVDTQARWGTLRGRVHSNGRLTFSGAGSFARPSTSAVFNCSVAPFHTSNDVMGNLSARLAAALNRTTLLANSRQPDASARHFYATSRTNHYARLVHRFSIDGQGYAFPYDDVHTHGWNAEGRVVHPRPKLLRIDAG
jgi:Beta-1,3-glucanase